MQEVKKPKGFAKAKKDCGSAAVEIPLVNPKSVLSKLDKIEKASIAARAVPVEVPAALINVIHGASDAKLELGGKTIAYAREQLQTPFNIPKDALSFIDGKEMVESHVLQANETLEFIRTAGTKG